MSSSDKFKPALTFVNHILVLQDSLLLNGDNYNFEVAWSHLSFNSFRFDQVWSLNYFLEVVNLSNKAKVIFKSIYSNLLNKFGGYFCPV